MFQEVTPLVEPLSIDEAFLDVSGCRFRGAEVEGEALARDIQARVAEATGGLSCSIGVAENKFLAKVASDLKKPRGVVVVPPGSALAFLAPLSVERLWGVGPKTAARLHALGLHRVRDVSRLEQDDLERLLGHEFGRHLYRLSRGMDDRPVITDWESKSISQETTLAEFLPAEDSEAISALLFEMSDGVAFRLRHESLWGRTVHIKVRDDRFHTVTRARTLESPTQVVEEIYAVALELYREKVRLGGRRVRLLGVGVTQLSREALRQLDLFADTLVEDEQARARAAVTDAIRAKLGDDAITRGRLLGRAPRGGHRS